MKKPFTPIYVYPNAKTPVFSGAKVNKKVFKRINDTYIRNSGTWWPAFFPTVIGLITAGNMKKNNIMTVSCLTVMNRLPFLLGMPIFSENKPQEGIRPRFTLALIKKTKEFSVNIAYIDNHLTQAIRACGSFSGWNGIDKFKESGLTPAKGMCIKSPIIQECPMNFECKLRKIIDLGSHSWVIGEVVGIHIDERLADGTKEMIWRSLPEMK